tara:strand:+ start:800 stop:1354 length:555 start_codon:yes stop_codon:yes gene_type:complete
MYSILEKLENIERTLANPSYRAAAQRKKNNIKIFLVSADNNTDWLIANKTQIHAIHLFETGRVLPTREDARDSLTEGKPSVSEYKIKSYTFYQLIHGHKIFRYMESDLSKQQGQNLKREFMNVYIEVDDDVQINNIEDLTLKCKHGNPRGPDLIFELDGREIARRGAPLVFSYDEVMKGNVGGM